MEPMMRQNSVVWCRLATMLGAIRRYDRIEGIEEDSLAKRIKKKKAGTMVHKRSNCDALARAEPICTKVICGVAGKDDLRWADDYGEAVKRRKLTDF